MHTYAHIYVCINIYVYTDTRIHTCIHLTRLIDMRTQNDNNNHICVLGQETHNKETLLLSYEPPSTFRDNLFSTIYIQIYAE